MAATKRSGNGRSPIAAPQRSRSAHDGFIETLHPEGSSNNIRIAIERRKLVRPTIHYWKAALNVLTPALTYFFVFRRNVPLALSGFCVYSLFRLRGVVIWCIRVYQRYAPEEMRLSCVFEPSCSEYMILSMNKYGVFLGGIKGIKRLRRCHLPNGGEDYP